MENFNKRKKPDFTADKCFYENFYKICSLREYWSHFKAKNRVFQRRLNEILETARTYGFQFRDN